MIALMSSWKGSLDPKNIIKTIGLIALKLCWSKPTLMCIATYTDVQVKHLVIFKISDYLLSYNVTFCIGESNRKLFLLVWHNSCIY